jgi:ankyrin repeat protein
LTVNFRLIILNYEIYLASKNGHKNVVQFLLEKKAIVNERMKGTGWNALHIGKF